MASQLRRPCKRLRRVAFVGIIVMCFAAAASEWAAPAGAAGGLVVRVAQPQLSTAASGQHLIVVGARTAPAAVCEAVVRVAKVRTSLAKVKANAKGSVAWRWIILPTSPSGTWHFTVACRRDSRAGSGATRALIVTASTKSSGPIGDPASLETPSGTPIGRGGGVSMQCGPFTYVYPNPQCTCLAYAKRPDIYNTAVNVKHVVAAGGNRVVGSDRTDYYVWDGEQWLVNAQAAGIPTGSQPVAGAIVVLGVANSAGYGHVQYVDAVNSPTDIQITECNYDWHGSCRTTWENPEALTDPLQGYIYGGPAGNGPSAPSGGGPPAPTGTANGGTAIVNTNSGRCLDVPGATTTPGTALQIFDCNGSAAQQWVLVNGALQVYSNECLDIRGGSLVSGTPVQLFSCNGTQAQQWTVNANGTITTVNGLCLDVEGGATANNTAVQIFNCNGSGAQQWAL